MFAWYPWWRHQMERCSAVLAPSEGIHRPPVDTPRRGQWRGALIFSLICAWTNGRHYNVTVMDNDDHLCLPSCQFTPKVARVKWLCYRQYGKPNPTLPLQVTSRIMVILDINDMAQIKSHAVEKLRRKLVQWYYMNILFRIWYMKPYIEIRLLWHWCVLFIWSHFRLKYYVLKFLFLL